MDLSWFSILVPTFIDAIVIQFVRAPLTDNVLAVFAFHWINNQVVADTTEQRVIDFTN